MNTLIHGLGILVATHLGRIGKLASCIVLLVLVFAPVRPAGAHTDLVQSSPGVNQTSGGDIQFMDLVFGERVSTFKMTVTDPSGAVIPGRVLTDQGFVVSYGFDNSLKVEGRHVVEYNMVSYDGDFTEREFVFFYDDSAAQPFRIDSEGRAVEVQAGTNWMSLLSTLLLVVSAVGIALLLLHRQGFFSSSRMITETPEVDDSDSEVDSFESEAEATNSDTDELISAVDESEE